MKVAMYQGDCLEVMRGFRAGSVDLVMTSPPYEAARTYGIGFKLRGREYVHWAADRFMECLRVSRGLVVWVVEGQTRRREWSAMPMELAVEIKRRGAILRKPPIYYRFSIPGSGGPDYFRNDYEFCIVATAHKGKLAWSDNTACGHPPKWGPGGEMSNRLGNGARVNQRGRVGSAKGMGNKSPDGKQENPERPSHETAVLNPFGSQQSSVGRRANGEKKKPYFNGKGHVGARLGTGQNLKGSIAGDGWKAPTMRVAAGISSTGEQLPNHTKPFPKIANPGNVIRCSVGGGSMGDRYCHENEAPYPEALAERFIRSFCPPGGVVLDPFGGSGTTAKVAVMHGRNAVLIDVRDGKGAMDTARRRVEAWNEANPEKACRLVVKGGKTP